METVEFAGNKFQVPLVILNALQAADFSDGQIYLMTPYERFKAYCEWEGLIGGWHDVLWNMFVEMKEQLNDPR